MKLQVIERCTANVACCVALLVAVVACGGGGGTDFATSSGGDTITYSTKNFTADSQSLGSSVASITNFEDVPISVNGNSSAALTIANETSSLIAALDSNGEVRGLTLSGLTRSGRNIEEISAESTALTLLLFAPSLATTDPERVNAIYQSLRSNSDFLSAVSYIQSQLKSNSLEAAVTSPEWSRLANICVKGVESRANAERGISPGVETLIEKAKVGMVVRKVNEIGGLTVADVEIVNAGRRHVKIFQRALDKNGNEIGVEDITNSPQFGGTMTGAIPLSISLNGISQFGLPTKESVSFQVGQTGNGDKVDRLETYLVGPGLQDPGIAVPQSIIDRASAVSGELSGTSVCAYVVAPILDHLVNLASESKNAIVRGASELWDKFSTAGNAKQLADQLVSQRDLSEISISAVNLGLLVLHNALTHAKDTGSIASITLKGKAYVLSVSKVKAAALLKIWTLLSGAVAAVNATTYAAELLSVPSVSVFQHFQDDTDGGGGENNTFTRDDLVGTWQLYQVGIDDKFFEIPGNVTWPDGSKGFVDVSVTFKHDGTFVSQSFDQLGLRYISERGTWTINGSTVTTQIVDSPYDDDAPGPQSSQLSMSADKRKFSIHSPAAYQDDDHIEYSYRSTMRFERK